MRRGICQRLFIACALAAACALTSSGCGDARDRTQVIAASSEVAARGAPAIDAQATAGGMEHGDHNPHHGGVVYMYDEMHYEVVLDGAGHHRVYFTDSGRQDLPASVASSVTLTVERPQTAPEPLSGVIDQQGESWLFDGTPVRQPATTVRVAFVVRGGEYWIDVPFIPGSE